jgi:hypothetical protein
VTKVQLVFDEPSDLHRWHYYREAFDRYAATIHRGPLFVRAEIIEDYGISVIVDDDRPCEALASRDPGQVKP